MMDTQKNKPSNRVKKPRLTTLVVDLKDLKAPWIDWCDTQNLTPSEAVRRALQDLLRTSDKRYDRAVALDRADWGTGRKRVEIRLSQSAYSAISVAAAQEGMTVPRWLQALVAVHIGKRAQFGAPEVAALVKSNQGLLSIGRGLYQIVRGMSDASPNAELSRAQIAFVTDLIRNHVKEVSQLLSENAGRWTP